MKFVKGDEVKHKWRGGAWVVVRASPVENLVYCRRYLEVLDEFDEEGFKEQELEPVEKTLELSKRIPQAKTGKKR